MVIGDRTHEKFTAEVVDLSSELTVCPFIADYPIEFGAIGAWVDGKALVCGGGEDPTSPEKLCYTYNNVSNAWDSHEPMIVNRQTFSGTLLENGDWWITGRIARLLKYKKQILF